MYSRRDSGPPDRWETRQVLKWIHENDDSRGEIKSRVMGVVRANDLDGHTLRQLIAEKDEIQDLFPGLKERLAFKSMLRQLFKEETLVLPTEPPTLPKQTPQAPPGQHPKDLLPTSLDPNSLHIRKFANKLPQLANLNSTQNTRTLHRDKFPMTSTHCAAEDVNHQPLEKRPRLSLNVVNPPPPAPISVRKPIEQVTRNPVPSGPHEIQRAVNTPTSSVHINTSVPVYFHYPTIAGCLQANRNTNSTYITPSAIPSPIPSVSQSVTPASNTTRSSPKISSVTSLALHVADEATPNPRPVHLPSCDPTLHRQTPRAASPQPIIPRYHVMRIDYPAPIPMFSARLEELLGPSMGGMIGTVRKRLVRECSYFYVGITKGQRLSSSDYANIGRTMIEKYPELANDDSAVPWFSFNKSLSQGIRNLRRRLRQTNDSSLWADDQMVGASRGGLTTLQVVSLDPAEVVSDGEDGVEEVIEDDEDGDEEAEVFIVKEEMLA